LKKKTNQNKRHLAARQRYQLKRSRWANGKRNKKLGKYSFTGELEYVICPAPIYFNLSPINADRTIEYINQVKKLGNKRKGVDFNLRDVTDIGVGAISMLLSVMEELRGQGIRFRGTKPDNIDAKNVLERSGFMKFVHGNVSIENKNSKNIIFTGNKRTHHTEILDAIHDSMETVWGVKGRSQLLYGTIVEMIKNSCKHAFKSDKNVRWHFAVSHDQMTNTVKFSFVDNGIGVVSSHEKDNLLRKFGGIFRNNAEFIEGAYTEGIKSKTGLSWRGTGLPTIYETFDFGIIKNLAVITNDVYCNFDSNSKLILNNQFKGTYYFLEVNKDCFKQCFPIEYDRN